MQKVSLQITDHGSQITDHQSHSTHFGKVDRVMRTSREAKTSQITPVMINNSLAIDNL